MSSDTKPTGLHLGHLNIYHLQKKVSDLCVLLNKQKTHIFGVSETRIKLERDGMVNKISDDSLSIPHYQLFRRDCSENKHRGLAVYVHDSISKFVKRRLDLEIGTVECIWLEFKNGKSNSLLIGNIYRNRSYDWSEWLDNFIQIMDKATDNHKNITLLGDFNIDLSKSQEKWRSAISLFNLKQLIKQQTRITDSTATIIDHIYTNNPDMITNARVVSSSISDHNSVTCCWSCKLPKPPKKGHTTIEYRSFKKFEDSYFLSDVYSAPFHTVYNEHSAETAFDKFCHLFISIIDKHAPIKQHRVKHPSIPPWLTQDIIEAMAERDSLKENKKTSEFKKQRNKVNRMQTNAKRDYFNSLLEKNKDTATIWRAMNEIIDKRKKPGNSQKTDLSPDEFNEHFLSLADKMRDKIQTTDNDNISDYLYNIQQFCNRRQESELGFSIPYIAVYEVGKFIESLDNKKSMGPDKIPVRLLKLSLPYIVEPLTFIYNLCIEQNVFPSTLKVAKVIPLPKSNDRSDPNNFRPISLLPILSKPLEKHIQKHLLKYMETNNFFHEFQSGFREKHSCTTALATLCDSWLSSINNKDMTGAIFLDFRKAFDMVDHSILLEKLRIYLKNDTSVSFFNSYLNQRRQYVSLNCSQSNVGHIRYGVPQGSILGPILFCMYINDLPLDFNNARVRCDLYADDSTLHSSGKKLENIEKDLQSSLNKIDSWCKTNSMFLHPDKTKCMLISTRQKHQRKKMSLNLSISSTAIDQVSEHRVLGVVIDQDMNWKLHLQKICKSLSRNLYLMAKLYSFTDRKALMMFFNAHIMSHINFASIIWDGASQVNLNKINSLHRRAAKIIAKGHEVSTDSKLKLLNILPLEKQLLFNKATLMYKVHHSEVPGYISCLFQKAPERYSSQNYVLPKPRIDLYKTSLAFSGAATWNSLPDTIKGAISLKSFKNALFDTLV